MKKHLASIALYFALVFNAAAGVPCSLPFALQNSTTADATQVMANYNALVTCLTNAAAAGVNNDITQLLGLTGPFSPTLGGSTTFIGGTSTGGGNAQLITASIPTGFALTTGYSVVFVAGAANTGATQFNVNGTGLVNVFRPTPNGLAALVGGEIISGKIVHAYYDGTQFELLDVAKQDGGFGPNVTLAGAATTDLGTATNHNVTVSGAATITSFGAAANLTYPVYRVLFSGASVITYNQTNCSTTGGCINTPTAQSITARAGDTAVLDYLGAGSGGGGNWKVSFYQHADGTALISPTPLCGASGLQIVNNTGTPNTKSDITASSVVMINPTGNVPIFRTGIAVTINDTINGAGGLDTGSLAVNSQYYHYLIDNGTTTVGLDSLSATSPLMPSGYNYLCRLGARFTDGSANFYRTTQRGRYAQNLTLRLVTSGTNVGNITTPTYVSASLTGFVPTTATEATFTLTDNNGSSVAILAPNNSYGGVNSTTNPPYCQSVGPATGITSCRMMLESLSAFWAVSGTGQLYSSGWNDAVNAN